MKCPSKRTLKELSRLSPHMLTIPLPFLQKSSFFALGQSLCLFLRSQTCTILVTDGIISLNLEAASLALSQLATLRLELLRWFNFRRISS